MADPRIVNHLRYRGHKMPAQLAKLLRSNKRQRAQFVERLKTLGELTAEDAEKHGSPVRKFFVSPREAGLRLLACQSCDYWKPCQICTGQVMACSNPDMMSTLTNKNISLESWRCPINKWGQYMPGRRHLLYYVLPVKGNNVWQRNLDMLKARLSLFNGKRTVCIGYADSFYTRPKSKWVRITKNSHGLVKEYSGLELDPPEAVEEYLRGDGIDCVRIVNNPTLREVAAWQTLWESVQDYRDPDDFTFFAHAKGVTRPFNPGVTVTRWVDMLYQSLLDYWPLIREQLQTYPITGSFKKVGHGFQGSRSSWHYSGTFYWVRNADFFARDWRGVDQQWWGTESYPGIAYSTEEAGVVFKEGTVPHLNLYAMDLVEKYIEEFEQWKQEHKQHRTKGTNDLFATGC